VGFCCGHYSGFCGSLFPFCFPLSRCSLSILLVYLGEPHAFFIIKFDLTYQKEDRYQFISKYVLDILEKIGLLVLELLFSYGSQSKTLER